MSMAFNLLGTDSNQSAYFADPKHDAIFFHQSPQTNLSHERFGELLRSAWYSETRSQESICQLLSHLDSGVQRMVLQRKRKTEIAKAANLLARLGVEPITCAPPTGTVISQDQSHFPFAEDSNGNGFFSGVWTSYHMDDAIPLGESYVQASGNKQKMVCFVNKPAKSHMSNSRFSQLLEASYMTQAPESSEGCQDPFCRRSHSPEEVELLADYLPNKKVALYMGGVSNSNDLDTYLQASGPEQFLYELSQGTS